MASLVYPRRTRTMSEGMVSISLSRFVSMTSNEVWVKPARPASSVDATLGDVIGEDYFLLMRGFVHITDRLTHDGEDSYPCSERIPKPIRESARA